MSNNKLAIKPDPTSDLTELDIIEVNKFIDEGLPGIAAVGDDVLQKIGSLYHEGKTYSQIARILKIAPVIAMYLSKRNDWFTKKLRHKQEIASRLQERAMESELYSQDSMIRTIQYFEKRMQKLLDKFDSTNDDLHQLNLKEFDKYLKALKALKEMTGNKGPRNPGNQVSPVGLNVGSGITVTKNDDNSIDITPKQKQAADLLAEISESLWEEENKSRTVNDIKEETPLKSEGEPGNETED